MHTADPHVESESLAVEAVDVRHAYDDHVALAGMSLRVPQGKIFALLGPNGSGKTTLFRLLATLMPLQSGELRVAGVGVASVMEVRRRIGIVFQSPSLDKKLTVLENLRCQAALYGIRGALLRRRETEVLQRLRLEDRKNDFCEKLSGGLKRRVELAKGMLHQPEVLLLDEPSTGLDPGARLDLWEALNEFSKAGLSVVLTTHLLEEAEKADQIAILSEGKVIAQGAPDRLRSRMGAGLITITTEDPHAVCRRLREQLSLEGQALNNQVRLQSDHPGPLVSQLLDVLGDQATSVSVGRPSLEDVFIAETGYQFWSGAS
ncbi:MAG: ABC transporter ATP-binding protein [Pirellulaceae bacterium]